MADQNTFADAVAKAKEVAAKYSAQSLPLKRPGADPFGVPDTKRFMANTNVQFQNLPPGQVEQRQQAASQAQQIASRINQSLGASQTGVPPVGIVAPTGSPFDALGATVTAMPSQNALPGGLGQQVPAGPGMVTENFSVPDRMVGLIIGKGGETITRIQAESGAKIQMDSASSGLPERPCTLTGTPEQISAVKALIHNIINRSSNLPPDASNLPPGQDIVQISIPGNAVGLIIGKGGENIKKLQNENGVKMVLIQESQDSTPHPKPLRISGPAENVQKARVQVEALLEEKLGSGGRRGGGGGGYQNGYGGRGGGGRGDRGGGGYGGYGDDRKEYRHLVPADKTGLIIGKGGETIRDICDRSGAHVNISNEPPPDMNHKIFEIRGNQDQINKAIDLINEKAGIPPDQRGGGPPTGPSSAYGYGPGGPVPPGAMTGYPGMGGPGQPGMGGQQQPGGFPPGGPGGAGPGGMPGPQTAYPGQWNNPAASGPSPQGQQPGMPGAAGGPYGMPQQPSGVAPGQGQPSSGASVMPGASGAGDASKDSASWQQYYHQQYYGGNQSNPTSGAPTSNAVPGGVQQHNLGTMSQTSASATQPAGSVASLQYTSTTSAQTAAATSTPQPTLNPLTGQPDYSEAWANYYRAQGQYAYAEQILQQSRNPAALQQGAQQQTTTATNIVNPGQISGQQQAGAAIQPGVSSYSMVGQQQPGIRQPQQQPQMSMAYGQQQQPYAPQRSM